MSNVTSLDQLKQFAEGELVELPGFVSDQSFTAKLRRPSIMSMAKSGKIPNALLAAATELFTGKQDKNEPIDLKEITGVIEIVVEASFVEPTYEQIKEVGLELTDEQYMAVFNYTQKGIKALDSFRQK